MAGRLGFFFASIIVECSTRARVLHTHENMNEAKASKRQAQPTHERVLTTQHRLISAVVTQALHTSHCKYDHKWAIAKELRLQARIAFRKKLTRNNAQKD